jgi:hypothetical protein
VTGKPFNLDRDCDIKAAIRELLSDGVNRSEVIKRIAEDFDLSERTARRKVTEIEPHVEVSEAVTEAWETKKRAAKSRILWDIQRLDDVIELAMAKGEFKAIASLQAQKTALYKIHATAHPEALWIFPDEPDLATMQSTKT